MAAAEAGGGWVEYEWANPDAPNRPFQKVAYIFSLCRDGIEYYGGANQTVLISAPFTCSLLLQIGCVGWDVS